jgi:hypothetical protein
LIGRASRPAGGRCTIQAQNAGLKFSNLTILSLLRNALRLKPTGVVTRWVTPAETRTRLRQTAASPRCQQTIHSGNSQSVVRRESLFREIQLQQTFSSFGTVATGSAATVVF